MVQNVIPMSGPPNLIGDPVYVNTDGPGFMSALCAESDIACPSGLDLNGQINYLRSIKTLSEAKKIYDWLSHERSFGPLTGGPFWGNVDPIAVAESGSMKLANMMIGFTSFEGSLVEATYPYTYNKNNIMNAYSGVDPRNSYGECVNYSYDTKQFLISRYYQRMSCEYNFPQNQADMTNDHAIKMALAIYGDVSFRSGSVRHAMHYRNAGANVWVYNFDTDEHLVESSTLFGAPHASELKYFFGWGNQNLPWQAEIGTFLLRSWINFAVTGDPSSGDYNWVQFDGDEGHMEIENTESQAVFRNDAKFDFDLLVDLDVNDLENVYDGSCATTIITTTTQQPNGWCRQIDVSGEVAGIYNVGGRYTITDEIINSHSVWKLDNRNNWLHLGDDGIWGFYFTKNGNDRVIWKPKESDECPARDPGLWDYWTGSTVATAHSGLSIVEVNGPTSSTTTKPTTLPTTVPTTVGTTTTTPECTPIQLVDDCLNLIIDGWLAPTLTIGGIYGGVWNGQPHNCAPIWKYDGNDGPRYMFLGENNKWTVAFTLGGTPIMSQTQTDTCPARETADWIYHGEDGDSNAEPSTLNVAVAPALPRDCDQIEVSGSKTNIYMQFAGIYSVEESVEHNGAPVWKMGAGTDSRYIYLDSDNWWKIYSAIGFDSLIFDQRSPASLNCPGREPDNWMYWHEDFQTATGPSEISVTVYTQTTTTPPITTITKTTTPPTTTEGTTTASPTTTSTISAYLFSIYTKRYEYILALEDQSITYQFILIFTIYIIFVNHIYHKYIYISQIYIYHIRNLRILKKETGCQILLDG